MCRYSESIAALRVAMDLMADEGDALLVALISHPIDIAERRLRQVRIDRLAFAPAPPPATD